MEIAIGTAYTAETVVDKTNIASTIGSGLVDVFATPMMIALLELAASECVKPFLQPERATVGTVVNVVHTAATPVGMKVWATATVTAVDRRRVDFDVIVKDEAGDIGKGTHSRFIIDVEPFSQKAQQRGQ